MKKTKAGNYGSISLIQAVFVLTFGLVFVLAVAGLQQALGRSSERDKCLIEEGGSFDLLNPDLDIAAACPSPTPTSPY